MEAAQQKERGEEENHGAGCRRGIFSFSSSRHFVFVLSSQMLANLNSSEKSENTLEHLEQYSALVYSAHFPLSLLSKANEALMKLVSYGFLSGGWNCRILAKHEHRSTFLFSFMW